MAAPGDRPDPADAEARGLAQLAWTADQLVAGLHRALPSWARRRVVGLLSAWGEDDPALLAAAAVEAEAAGEAAAARIAADLGALLALDPEEQRRTPLQLVRTAFREPAEVLARHGVGPVVRDEFAERSWPDDEYGLVPGTLADLGDDDLAPLHLAWGVAKATVVRARRARSG